MSKISIANKYRPKTFDEIVEQDEIKAVLKHQIETNNLKHVYLFSGGAGTGKTSSARLIAKAMNNGDIGSIEIDCASHNSVNDADEINKACTTRPINSKYKIFILDECFEGSTLVNTPNGLIPINKLNIGDKVYTRSGINKIKNIKINKINNNRLIMIKLSNNKQIITTCNHLFATTEGWIEAKNLQKGDELFVQEKLYNMWENNEIQEENYQKDLFQDLSQLTYFAIRKDNKQFRIWSGIKETIISKNVNKQSNELKENYNQNETDQDEECYLTPEICLKNGKWEVYNTLELFIPKLRSFFMEEEVTDKNLNEKKQQSNEITYELQSRPWLRKIQNNDRGGWQIPSMETRYSERYQKMEQIGRISVESITFYQQKNNEQFGNSSSDYMEMYDLEIENDPTYFVEDILVHNCHMLTQQAWNALLKTLEEPPEFVIFILCTTDPQKIIPTIMSRVQKYNFNRISTEGIKNRLKYVLQQEGISTYEEESINYIARLAAGGMREALSTLEKCLDYNTNLTIENVQRVVSNGVGEDDFLFMLQTILNQDAKTGLEYYNKVYMRGVDNKLFLDLFKAYLENCIKYLITRNSDIVSLTDKSINWLEENEKFLDIIRDLLFSLLDLKSRFFSEDLKIIIESWIIEKCL